MAEKTDNKTTEDIEHAVQDDGQKALADASNADGAKAAKESDEKKAPISGHLKELRDRLLRSVIVVGVLMFASFFFGNDVLQWLLYPLRRASEMASTMEAPVYINLVALSALENISVFFKICLTSSLIVAMPYLVYQVLAFIVPGLTGKEKRLIFTALPFIVFMFLCGVAFAFFIALPPALAFLYTFNNDIATVLPSIADYVKLVTRMLLVIGFVFETPLIIMLLAKFGVVSPEWLSGKRKIWIVLAFVIAAVITPTPDPINQLIIAIPLILMLELGIILAKRVYKKKRNKDGTLVPVAQSGK